jgi:DNA-binding transcriptional LysR family regulator
MELRQLRAFAEVVQRGTFRAAASALHITQPALWQQVRALQDELGVALFERAGRRVRPTSAGRQLVEQAQGVLAAAGRMTELGAAIRSGRQGIVRIATPSPPVKHVLARVIGDVARSHPEVEIEVHDSSALATSPLDTLLAGHVDLAVAPHDPAYDGMRLYRVDVHVVVARTHRWSRRKQVHVRHLRNEPLLVAPPGALSRGLLERALAREGITPSIRLASPSPAMLVPLARSGFGAAIVAGDALAGVDTGPSAVLVDDARAMSTEVWLHWRRGAQLAPAAQLMIDRVTDQKKN